VYGSFQTQDGTFGGGDELVDVRNWELADLEDASIPDWVAGENAVFQTMVTKRKKNGASICPIQNMIVRKEAFSILGLNRLFEEFGNQ
jgi:hypothetical protein